MPDEADTVARALLVDLVCWCLEGPVDEEWAAYDIFAGNEAPIATVKALGAVVAHCKDLAGRNDQVVALNVLRQLLRPLLGHFRVGVR